MSGSHPRLHQSAAPAPNTLSSDKDAEMPATEKDLAEDAPWKKIQQNTFTRWCNEHLKCVNKRIGNLQTDLSDGLRLIGLLEVLSQKKMFRKYNQRPTFRQMQLENVSVALEFLERENIKLVSIGKFVRDHTHTRARAHARQVSSLLLVLKRRFTFCNWSINERPEVRMRNIGSALWPQR
eukprot:XP_011618790.1 PREDICTED: filamin-A-like [Takifugu rubripes]